MAVVTPEQYAYKTYWMTVFDTHYLIFTVRACSNAHIILANRPGIADFDSFEIIIGYNDNKETVIRRGPSAAILKNVSTPGILNCTELRDMWMSWEDNLISVGRGISAGINRILEYRDESKMKINAASFATAGTRGIWEFNEVKGEYG